MKIRSITGTRALLTGLAIAASSSSYADVTFNGEVSGNVTATSTYVWRGAAQGERGAAIQGGLNYADPTGLHFGAWTSTVEPGSELDLMVGYGLKSGGLDLGFGLIAYTYSDGPSDADFQELYANISQGQFSAQLSHSNDAGTYFEVAGAFPVKSWEMTAHLGHYSYKSNYKYKFQGDDYTDYSVNFSKSLPEFDLSFLFSDTDANDDELRSVVSVSKNFKL